MSKIGIKLQAIITEQVKLPSQKMQEAVTALVIATHELDQAGDDYEEALDSAGLSVDDGSEVADAIARLSIASTTQKSTPAERKELGDLFARIFPGEDEVTAAGVAVYNAALAFDAANDALKEVGLELLEADPNGPAPGE